MTPASASTARAACTALTLISLAAATALGQPKGPNIAKPVTSPTGAQPGTPAAGQPGKPDGSQVGPPSPKPTSLAPAPTQGTKGTEANDPDEQVMLPAFAEPVQLSTMVELVAKTLNINMTTQGEITGTVVFNAPVPVKKSELLGLLDALLEQQNFTITKDKFGLYTVQPYAAMTPKISSDDFATTRVFRTPNMRPSALKLAIEGQMGPPPQSPTGARTTAYIDELGIIIATDTPRRLSTMGELIQKMLTEASKSTFTRLELRYLAAPVARDRALQLVGQLSQPSRAGQVAANDPAGAQRQGVLDNLGDRLTVDAQGNALIFRGMPEETVQVQTVLNVIDVPNTLQPKSYFAGSAASQIANIASKRGLGEIITISDNGASGGFDGNVNRQPNANPASQTNNLQGGPVMVVNDSSGIIIYYGTPAQQANLADLVKELDTQAEKVIIGVYKLKNSDAEDVAQVIQGLIQNTTPVGTSSLLPNGGRPNTGRPGTQTQRPNPTNPRPASGSELTLDSSGFVIADKANNQILVKAPAGQQKEFARLIERLDLRRPQVYIEAQIVAVNWSDDLRVAFETQMINAKGLGGVLNTSFGLSSFATSALITQPKTVSTALGGLTGAVMKSDQVPFIVNALQTKANARVLSVPQILVNDNEEAEITSVDTQPTSSISRSSGNSDVISAGTPEEAGTKLKVKPSISEGGYLRLKYNMELSSFTGTQTTTSSGTLPSPKQVNTITAEAVTVPTDTTVIIGGLNFDSKRLTKAQIPLIGDIPIIGYLFGDHTSNDRITTLYVFLTPKILRDPTFADLRLITSGPQAKMKLESDIPPLKTVNIDINHNQSPPMAPAESIPTPAPAPAAPAPSSAPGAPAWAPLNPEPTKPIDQAPTKAPAAAPTHPDAPPPSENKPLDPGPPIPPPDHP